jgi:hypothetical protein
MPTLQTAFNQFHDTIKLSDIDENQMLRDKRDILLEKLKKNISEDAASYTHFNQGSYAMHTGINPKDGDYDIDVGLKFSINKDDYPDPTVVKKWVKDALDGHTKSVEMRKPCVTVTYQRNDEALFHVDFAIYAKDGDGNLYLARGKESSLPENKFWEHSEPQELIDLVNNKFDGDDAKQFRRMIRYLKKWKTENYSATGHSAPTGIALTMLAYELFEPKYSVDIFNNFSRTYNDFDAFHELVSGIRNRFTSSYNTTEGRYDYDISVCTPTLARNDLFEKMTQTQKNSFYNKTVLLNDTLNEVKQKISDNKPLSEQCELLQDLFGCDFPILRDRSIVGTSESA